MATGTGWHFRPGSPIPDADLEGYSASLFLISIHLERDQPSGEQPAVDAAPNPQFKPQPLVSNRPGSAVRSGGTLDTAIRLRS